MLMTTDAQLIARAKTDASAFRELYDRYAERIHRLQLARSRDRDAALDLTAETFAQAWLSLDRFRDLAGGSASPWLYAIARNVLVTSVRKRTLERTACDRLGVLVRRERESHAPTPDEGWIEGLDEELASLSPELRQAVTLRVVDDLPYSDVAAATGTTVGAARVRVHRGLTALRQRLQEREATR
jgi:RNA polymerase sigma-70 factor, ECF subfamily